MVGALGGLLGGLLGVGGGIIIIPALLLVLHEQFGPGSLHVYKLAALLTSIVVSTPAAIRHLRARAVIPAMVASIVPLALFGSILGVALAAQFAGPQTHVLRRSFGVFMVLTVIANLWHSRRAARGVAAGAQSCPVPTRWPLIGTVVGAPSGIVSGLLGVGGGIWAVPAQHLALGIRLPNAVANSSCMIPFVTGFAAIVQAIAIARMPDIRVLDGFWLGALLAPGAALGGWFGAALTHRLPAVTLRMVFFALLVVTGVDLAVS
ncbi:MAG: TSUP family transporter [Phycisphaerae bacterium]